MRDALVPGQPGRRAAPGDHPADQAGHAELVEVLAAQAQQHQVGYSLADARRIDVPGPVVMPARTSSTAAGVPFRDTILTLGRVC